MRIGEAVAADKDRLGFIDVANQRRMKRVERFDQELIELEATGDQSRLRERLALRSIVGRETLMTVEKLAGEVRPPFNSITELPDQRMMDAAVKMINETPFAPAMDRSGIEGAFGVEAEIGVRPGRQGDGIVVEIVDADIEADAQTVEKRIVFADGDIGGLDGAAEPAHVPCEFDREMAELVPDCDGRAVVRRERKGEMRWRRGVARWLPQSVAPGRRRHPVRERYHLAQDFLEINTWPQAMFAATIIGLDGLPQRREIILKSMGRRPGLAPLPHLPVEGGD